MSDRQPTSSSTSDPITALIDYLRPGSVRPVQPAPTVAGSRAALLTFIANTQPPHLPAAMVADDRDCRRWAEYLAEFTAEANRHIEACLRDLKSQLIVRFDVRDLIDTMADFRADLVSQVEHAADGHE